MADAGLQTGRLTGAYRHRVAGRAVAGTKSWSWTRATSSSPARRPSETAPSRSPAPVVWLLTFPGAGVVESGGRNRSQFERAVAPGSGVPR
jgi:hypothetical protein